MLAYKAKNRIPTVSLFNALKDIMQQFEKGISFSFYEAKLISETQYYKYLDWLNLDKLYVKKPFSTIFEVKDENQESVKKHFYKFRKKIIEISIED